MAFGDLDGFRHLFGLDREIARVNADMMRQTQYVSFMDQVARMPGARLDEIVSQVLVPTADELLKSIYMPPLDHLRDQMLGIGFENIVRNSIVGIGRSILSVGESVGRIHELFRQPAEIGSLFPSLDIGSFIQPLPDLGPFLGWAEETAATVGADALDEGGYGFSDHLFTQRFLASMAWITPKVRGAAVTNRLIAYTRQTQFEEELISYFDKSSFLRRRRPIVERALNAHRSRDYILAIPTLLAQVEGVLGDAFVLKGSVIAKGQKLYVKGPDGKPKPNRKGKPTLITGAKMLLQNRGLENHPILQEVSNVLTNGLIDERNGILHGRSTNYHKAGLSVRALLILIVAAPDIVAFEAGEIESDLRDT